jgi:hypothetical protein
VAATAQGPVRVPARAPEQVQVRVPVRAQVLDSATALSAPDYRCRTRRRRPESESLGRHTGRAFCAT